MNNKETYIKRIDAFKYESRKEYEKRNKTITFSVVMGLAILDIVLSIFFIIIGKDIEGIFAGIVSLQMIMATIFAVIFGFFSADEFDFDFLEEIKDRYRMRDKQYQPVSFIAELDLNDIVQLSNGKLFRQYQFINAEESDINNIAIELPKNAKIIGFDNTNREERIRLKKMCMFACLNERELSKIITPIREYYRSKEISKKIKKEENLIKKQSKINATITYDEIHNLPLFKTYKNLSNKAQEDVKGYNNEKHEHLKNLKKIIS
ncbi:hypothetical protein BUY32_11835 [Staphylococcus cohnii]|uniref:hypothetical protein n=1 Tax=Staphylococcus cohnii TaxID=29382 RepID=UPI000E67B363|nr:hypothetical protein [Staphylococcus cohnii]RIL88133.1 hypothetical protein BUY32_11835 [Staphylococcus cohnii]